MPARRYGGDFIAFVNMYSADGDLAWSVDFHTKEGIAESNEADSETGMGSAAEGRDAYLEVRWRRRRWGARGGRLGDGGRRRGGGWGRSRGRGARGPHTTCEGGRDAIGSLFMLYYSSISY